LQLCSEPPKPKENVRIERRFAIEMGIENGIERTISNFRRLFTNEFAALMRGNRSRSFDQIEGFTSAMGSEIEEEVKKAAELSSPLRTVITSAVTNTFDRFVSEFHSFMNEAYEERELREVGFFQDFNFLRTEIESLNEEYKSYTKKLLRESSAQANDLAYRESARKMKAQRLESRHRELMLAQIELESRCNRQIRDREKVQEELFQLDLKRRELLREPVGQAVETSAVHSAILRELRLLENELQDDKLGGMLHRTLELASVEGRGWVSEVTLIERLANDARIIIQNRGKRRSTGDCEVAELFEDGADESIHSNESRNKLFQ
jgi:hypothetical protein